LLQLEGVGQTSAMKLLRKFKSVNKIRQASLEELSAVVGKAKANSILKQLSK
jgi:excinuclease ABC subunit C